MEDRKMAATSAIDRPGHGGREPGADHKLTLVLPASVVRQLRTRMAAEGTTIRALVLESLQATGYAVPQEEVRDRRRGPPSRSLALTAPLPQPSGPSDAPAAPAAPAARGMAA
jgi:hypothetical protein